MSILKKIPLIIIYTVIITLIVVGAITIFLWAMWKLDVVFPIT